MGLRLLALAIVVALAAQSMQALASGVYMEPLWSWDTASEGVVVDLWVEWPSVYVLASIEGLGGVVYRLESGSVVAALRLPKGLEPLSLRLYGGEVLVLARDGDNFTLLSIDGGLGGYRVEYSFYNYDFLSEIVCGAITELRDIVLCGGRASPGSGVDLVVKLAGPDGLVWSARWGGGGDDYFNVVSVGRNSVFCMGGPSGWVACITQDGRALVNTSVGYRVLSVYSLGGGSLLVAGVDGGVGVVELIEGGEPRWSYRLEGLVFSAVAGWGGLAIAGGVLVGEERRGAVLVLDAETGSPLRLGLYESEALITSIAVGEGGVIVVGGSSGGRPFVGAISLEEAPEGGPSLAGILASPATTMILLALLSIAVAANLYLYRRARRRGSNGEGGGAGSSRGAGGEEGAKRAIRLPSNDPGGCRGRCGAASSW